MADRHSVTLITQTGDVPIFLDALEPFAEAVNAFEVTSPLPGGEAAHSAGEGIDWETNKSPHPRIKSVAGSTLSPGEKVHWTITAILISGFDRIALGTAIALAAAAANIPEPELTIAPVEDIDYVSAVQNNFPAFRIGKFFLHGSHYRPRPGDGPLRLLVNAGMAFGSGEHPTTQGCLMAMQDLAKRRSIAYAIDMGCGSGILSLAAAKLWGARMTAIDIDAEAARVTTANAKLNGVQRLIRAGAGNGYAAPLLRRKGRADLPIDLIVCNIVARPLKRMAPYLAQNLKPGGYAILSGLLDHQVPGVLAAHYAQGLRLVKRYPIGEWRTLMLRK